MEQGKPIKEILQRIAFECQESGATKWQVLRVLKEIEKEPGNEQQLKRKAAEGLEKLNPAAAKTFLSFERMRVFTSREKREAFDRGNIIKSLIKETRISRHVAEKIGGEVEDKIKDLKIDYLNTQVIREMVSVKLLEYGHEPTHNEYARIGMPVYEVRKKLESGFFENREILKEYNWIAAIPEKAREMHFDSLIHIYSPEDFSTKAFCHSFFSDSPKEELAMKASQLDKLLSVPATLEAANFALAGTNKSAAKTSEELDSAEKIFSLTGKKRAAELALFSDYEWEGLTSKKKNALTIAGLCLKRKPGAFSFYVSLDSKYKLKLLDMKSLESGITIANNSKDRVVNYEFGPLVGANGLVQLTGINLEKIREGTLGEEGFFKKLDEVGEAVIEMCEKKKETLKKRPYFEEWMAEGAPGASLSGLANASAALNERSPQKTSETILSTLQKKGFVIADMPQETAEQKFGAAPDRKKTQELLLQLGAKQRRNYGFTYTAESRKEAEKMVEECPSVLFTTRDNS